MISIWIRKKKSKMRSWCVKRNKNASQFFQSSVHKESKLCLNCYISSALELSNTIYKKGLESILPRICMSLYLLILLPVSVASGERAFSKLILTENCLQSTTHEDRLNNLLLLNIEHKSLTDCLLKISKWFHCNEG